VQALQKNIHIGKKSFAGKSIVINLALLMIKDVHIFRGK
jgi:hypothetical protein